MCVQATSSDASEDAERDGKAVQAITAPASYLSAITVAAYKRHTLVSLIHQGVVQPFPKYTSQVVQRHVKRPCAAYTELATAYATHSHDQVAACVAKHEAEYVQDTTFSREEKRRKAVRHMYRRRQGKQQWDTCVEISREGKTARVDEDDDVARGLELVR